MLWGNDETRRLTALIAAGARAWSASGLLEVLSAASSHKPLGFDRNSAALQVRYSGNQRAAVEAVLAQRYPSVARRMPVAPLNWALLVAASDAGVYRQPPDRWLSDGERLPSDDERAALFASLLDDSHLDVVMAEAERRLVIAHNVIMHTSWDAHVQALRVTPYWAHDVLALPHPSRPTDFSSAPVVALRQAPPSAGSDAEWWWVWSRSPVEDDSGEVVSWGPWYHTRVSTAGEQQGPAIPAEYPGTVLPICLLQSQPPEGSWLVDRDRDLVSLVDELNASRANEQYVMDLQGHTQGIYAGTMVEATQLVLGPDTLLRIGPGEQITTVDFNPKLDDMRESRKLSLRELASSRRNSPDAYAVEPGPPLSGVSRQIANAPHEARLDEMRRILVDFERRVLLPTLLDVVDTFAHPDVFAGLTANMAARKTEEYEEKEAAQRRAQEAVDAGWISPARGAVSAGWYATVDEAVAAGLSDALPLSSQPATSALANRLGLLGGG